MEESFGENTETLFCEMSFHKHSASLHVVRAAAFLVYGFLWQNICGWLKVGRVTKLNWKRPVVHRICFVLRFFSFPKSSFSCTSTPKKTTACSFHCNSSSITSLKIIFFLIESATSAHHHIFSFPSSLLKLAGKRKNYIVVRAAVVEI